MKNLILGGLLLVTLQGVQAKTLIVSDVDDTIKVTDVLGKKSEIVVNGLFSKKAFAGMSELFQQMATDDTEIYYVSGSPKFIKIRINEFLEENKFPQRKNLILKDKMSDDTFKYKTDAIKGLIKKINPDKVILIGDDTEYDPEIFNGISASYPGLVESIYIHTVQNREFQGTRFFSAVEIAGSEIEKGNLKEESLAPVVKGFVKQTNCSAISIKKRYCPQSGTALIEELKQKSTSEQNITLLEQSQSKIINSCK